METTNKYGGRSSYISARFDLIPQDALMIIAEVLAMGAAKYGENNWRRITVAEHLNHVWNHLSLYMQGDTNEDHLTHAAARVLFAMYVDANGVVTEQVASPIVEETLNELFENVDDSTFEYPFPDFLPEVNTNDDTY